MRAFPVRLPSGARYWTVLDENLAVVEDADAFLRHVRFGRDGSELTTRSYAGGIALFLRWCARTRRHWHDGVAALGLFVTWLRHAGPQASGVDVVAGGQVLAGPGTEPVRRARRINGVLTAVRGFVAHAVAAGRAPGELLPLIYELVDERDLPAHARGEGHRMAWRLRARHRLHEPETVVDRAGDAEIVALLQACRSARDRLIVLLMARAGLRRGELCGLRRSDVHLLADSRLLGCEMPRAHLHVVRRAQVINISEAACYQVTRPIDESGLGAAIEYAVTVKGAVVIAAAGNTGRDCTQNPPPDPAIPADPRGWRRVQTIVTPAWYSPLVLTVGGIGQNGQPSAFSMSGPWVGAAAPAENIAALGYDGAPVNALPGRDGPIPIAGTSFAAAYVSGLAALLKQRFPDLTAAQVINRITATARHPGGSVDNHVGAGVIDPVAALTSDVPAGPKTVPYRVKQLPPPVLPPRDRGPITAVVIAGVGLALALGLGALARRALRRR